MISLGTLLVITVLQNVNINSTCGINSRTLSGIHLVTFHNCSLYVRNQLYENYELRFYQPTILPLQPIKIKAFQIDRHVNISELHELNILNRQHLDTIHVKHIVGFTSLSTIIIFLLAVTGFGIFKFKQITKTLHCSGRAILMGEAVKNDIAQQQRATPAPSAHGNHIPKASEPKGVDNGKSAVVPTIGWPLAKDDTWMNVTSAAALANRCEPLATTRGAT